MQQRRDRPGNSEKEYDYMGQLHRIAAEGSEVKVRLICFNKKQRLYKCDHPYIALSAQFEDDCVWIISLRVDEEYRGAGLGLDALCAVMRESGERPVFVFPKADFEFDQDRIEDWYRKLGFFPIVMATGQTAYVFTL